MTRTNTVCALPNTRSSNVDRNAAKGTVLVADDDPIVRNMLATQLEKANYDVVVTTNGEEALEAMHDGVAAALLDLHMPRMNGIRCLQLIRKQFPDAQVIMITASEDVNDAVRAMKEGAIEYLAKPIDPIELTLLVDRACRDADLRRHNRELTTVVGKSLPTTDFSANSPTSQRLLKQVHKVAHLDSTVLITGESGTGKTTIARMIHRQGPRHPGPFVAVNCASLPRDLIEAELFGHAKGAFTGAVNDRPGRVEIADGGTLFLDEIGDLPLELQPKLLTFLQDRRIQRIGSNKEISVDVRLIAATHQNLEQMCLEKRFRQDLFYRLNVLSLLVPPIRERREDVPSLVANIVRRISERRGCEPLTINPQVMEQLVRYSWPGNIRQLENVLERASAFSEGAIRIDDLSIPDRTSSGPDTNEEDSTFVPLVGKTLAEIESLAIQHTLRACSGNKAKTARELGISEKSIYNKMKRHGLK